MSRRTFPRQLRRGWAGTLAVLLLMVGVASAPPWLPSAWREVVMEAFAPFCHQMSARSPHLQGVALAVCHRCYGIYWGLPLAVLLVPFLSSWAGWFHRNTRYVLLGALLPAGVDWLGGLSGVWSNVPLSRLLTGMLFGLAAGYYLLHAVLGWTQSASAART